MDLSFLKSIRFWKLFIIAIVEFLAMQGIIAPALAHSIAIWLGGSVAIRTVDRTADKAAEARSHTETAEPV